MPTTTDWGKQREAWRSLVGRLTTDISRWAEEQGWLVQKGEKNIAEGRLGSYVVPDLVIRLPEGRIAVEVVGRDVVGADGRVDIQAFPAFSRMLLVRKDRRWQIKTDSGVNWPRPWNKRTFVELAKSLATAR